MKAQDHRLARIEELSGFAVAEDEPDVRGWEVIARDGRRAGVVEDLLVDTEDPQVRYLEVRLDRGADQELPLPREAGPTGTLEGDLQESAIPELDSLADQGGVIGQATVPGKGRPEMPARTIGESLVRDSLLDVENRMTADESSADPWNRGGRRVLVPFDRARLDTAGRRVHIESLSE